MLIEMSLREGRFKRRGSQSPKDVLEKGVVVSQSVVMSW